LSVGEAQNFRFDGVFESRFEAWSQKQAPWPGVGGVEAYPKCHQGRYEYCGWQIVGGSGDIPGRSRANISVLPTVAEHLDPKAVYMFGIDPANPSVNLRFTVAAITAGGQPQYANNKIIATGVGNEILSDSFNRSDQPILVNNWSVISTAALGSPLVFECFNLNAQPIRIFITLWGNAMNDWFVSEWLNANQNNKDIYVVKTMPIEAPWAYELVEKDRETGEKHLLQLEGGFTTRYDKLQATGRGKPKKRRRPKSRSRRAARSSRRSRK